MTSNSAQFNASNPFDSVWVSASAGTGKTKVLVDRVLRLLLQYGNPDKILCITFTKAAAAEMNNRLTQKLKEWAVLDKSLLISQLQDLTQEIPDDDLLERARGLFSQILQVPGGMKIMTIHSFCQSILKQFPLEADVPPHFEVIDEITTETFLSEALDKTLAEKSLEQDTRLLSEYVSITQLVPLFKNLLENRIRLQHLMFERPGGVESVIFALKQFFNIHKYHTDKEIINQVCSVDEWDHFKTTYLTNDGLIRAKEKDSEMAEQVYDIFQKLKKYHVVQATSVLLKIAYRILEKYNTYKQQNALLDYTDLIDKTHTLLTQSNMAAWVLFKLDGGLNHILVDEAQDTSPNQWAIIRMLAEEFFTGESKSEILRTLFVVGDKKQSIYSFQGADPFEFERMKIYFAERIQDSQNTFADIPLNYSFRSTEPILRLVNKVLADDLAKEGVLFENEEAVHLANRSNDAGLVEIWPLEEPQDQDQPPAWKPPVERVQSQSAMQRLIDKVADKIASMINKEELPSKGRLIQPGDFLILLQKRKPMMDPFVRALQQRNIPVAGMDRMVLTDYIAIQDLMSLTEFVLQPENDLNLAELLRSPLIGFTEEQLYQVCIHRKGSVWEQLQQLFPEQANRLSQMMNLADTMTPFEFYDTILGAFQGRKNFVSRLGSEANEALDEFLNLTVKFEQNNTPSLQGFLAWLYNQEIEIKRDLEGNTTNAVRIMTVHGSKGLQGNIVFLPDTRGVDPKSPSYGNLVWSPDGLPIWISHAEFKTEETQELLAQKDLLAEQEKHRLLYVALTRASDRLYICGFNPRKAATKNNWYDLIINAAGLTDFSKTPALVWETKQQNPPTEHKAISTIPDAIEIPSWMDQPAPIDPDKNTVSPSKLGDDFEEYNDDSPADTKRLLALKRGTFIHQLLQLLPTIPSDQWHTILDVMTPSDIDLPPNLLEIFDDPKFKDLFGPNSLSEVPVIGTWDNMDISGQIDRLVVRDKDVLIIDFKTNRIVPNTIPESYKKQLNAYQGLLKQIFPDKMIRTYLLWIQTMEIVEVQ